MLSFVYFTITIHTLAVYKLPTQLFTDLVVNIIRAVGVMRRAIHTLPPIPTKYMILLGICAFAGGHSTSCIEYFVLCQDRDKSSREVTAGWSRHGRCIDVILQVYPSRGNSNRQMKACTLGTNHDEKKQPSSVTE